VLGKKCSLFVGFQAEGMSLELMASVFLPFRHLSVENKANIARQSQEAEGDRLSKSDLLTDSSVRLDSRDLQGSSLFGLRFAAT
jgi:hypothetical protein